MKRHQLVVPAAQLMDEPAGRVEREIVAGLGVDHRGHAEPLRQPHRAGGRHEAIARAVARLLETDPELESPDARVFQRIVARARRGLVYEAAG